MPDWLKLEAAQLVGIASILASLLTFYLGWRKERRFARRRQADQIRLAAASVITKLERWRELSLAVFDEAEAGFVEASEIVARNPERLDFIAARDFLWKEISRLRAASRRQIILENIQTSHAELIAYCPGSRLEFLNAFAMLNKAEELSFQRFQERTQAAVLEFRKSAEPFHTAQLGNALRSSSDDVRKQYLSELDAILKLAFASLNDMINRPDEALIFDRRGLGGGAIERVTTVRPA